MEAFGILEKLILIVLKRTTALVHGSHWHNFEVCHGSIV